MAWYDEIVRRDRIASEAPMGWRWMRDKAFNLLGTDMPQVARNQARNIGGALKQPRPRYEPWQNQMVDPSHGGGKFGAPGIGGEGLLMAALPGALGYRQFFKPGLSMARNYTRRQMIDRLRRGIGRQTPSIPQTPGGTVFRGTRFGKGATLNDLRASYARPSGAVRPTRGIIRSAFKPGPSTRGYSKPVDYTLKGVRPYRGPRGIGMYKGTKTGPVNPPPPRTPNPLRRMKQWWEKTNPWM